MVNLENIDKPKLLEFIETQSLKKKIVIPPISILKSFGFPVSEHNFLLENKSTISRLKQILLKLSKEGILIKRESKQDFKGTKEIGYDYISKS